MLKDILIVYGYNVIFAWTHLKKLAHASLEHARMKESLYLTVNIRNLVVPLKLLLMVS